MLQKRAFCTSTVLWLYLNVAGTKRAKLITHEAERESISRHRRTEVGLLVGNRRLCSLCKESAQAMKRRIGVVRRTGVGSYCRCWFSSFGYGIDLSFMELCA